MSCREMHAIIKPFNIVREEKQLVYKILHRAENEITQRYRNRRCDGMKFERIVASTKENKPTGGPIEEHIDQMALAVTMVA